MGWWLLALVVACGDAGEVAAAPEAAPEAVAQPVAPVPPVVPVAPVAPAAAAPSEPPPSISALPRPGQGAQRPEGLDNGDWAVEIAGKDHLSGKPWRLSEHVGPGASAKTQAVLVSFSASWCGPCQASLPQLGELAKEHGEALEIVIVSTDANEVGLRKEIQFVKQAGLAASVVHADEALLQAWLGGRRNVPHMYLVNRVGEVLVQNRGYGNNVKRLLPGQVRYALSHPEYVPRR